jgi:adenosylcobinamide-GDP ribazoletransferase
MFLTRLPCPSWTDHHPAYLMRSMLYFPPVGLIVGAWGATWHISAAALWGPRIAAIVSTASTVWLTGCFHEDGLADTIDGFGGGWGRAQILRIMKDSRVGTYGCVGMILAELLKVEALARLEVAHASRALLVGHCLSRWVSLPLLFYSVYIQVRANYNCHLLDLCDFLFSNGHNGKQWSNITENCQNTLKMQDLFDEIQSGHRMW